MAIFEYQPAVLHAKTLINDAWVCVGTTNLNHRNFYHDHELDEAVHGSNACAALADQFQSDLAASHRVTFDRLTKRSWVEKISACLICPFRRFN